MRSKNPLRYECDLIQETSTVLASLRPEGEAHPCRWHGAGAGGQGLLLGALAL